MGFIMFLARKIQLEHEQNNVQFQLTSISNKLQDYTNYVSILSSDSVQMADMASIPTTLFSQGLFELGNAHNQAVQIANAQMGQAQSSGMFGQNPNPQMMNITYQKLYENARKQIQKQLQARMNEEEKQLQTKKTMLDTRLTMITKELESLDQHIGSGIKSQISNYGLQG